MDRRARFASVVVPTYNERQNLPRLVAAIAEHMPIDYEIVVVDDASPDGTGELALDLATRHPIRLVSRPPRAGWAARTATASRRPRATSSSRWTPTSPTT